MPGFGLGTRCVFSFAPLNSLLVANGSLILYTRKGRLREVKTLPRSTQLMRDGTRGPCPGLCASSPCSANSEQGLETAVDRVTLPLKCQAPGAWAHGSRAVSSWNDSCYFFPFLPSRSPWSNKYDPPLEDGAMPSARLRKLEVEANNAFDQYRDL